MNREYSPLSIAEEHVVGESYVIILSFTATATPASTPLDFSRGAEGGVQYTKAFMIGFLSEITFLH